MVNILNLQKIPKFVSISPLQIAIWTKKIGNRRPNPSMYTYTCRIVNGMIFLIFIQKAKEDRYKSEGEVQFLRNSLKSQEEELEKLRSQRDELLSGQKRERSEREQHFQHKLDSFQSQVQFKVGSLKTVYAYAILEDKSIPIHPLAFYSLTVYTSHQQ